MTDFRLLALDLDGTTLLPDSTLSARVVQAIAQARARGVSVALATARRWTGAAPIAEALGHAGPVIIYDGAIEREYPDGQTVSSHMLSSDLVQQVANLLAEYELQVVSQHSGEQELMSASDAPPHPDWMDTYIRAFPDQITMTPLAQIGVAFGDTVRIVSFGPESRLRSAFDALDALPVGRQILPHGSYGTAELTVFSPSASKGAALAWLAERQGIALAKTMAIGDGVNDISMLRIAGLGVAMGNASPEVKLAAGAVTESNLRDGVALAIEQYLLGSASEIDSDEAKETA